MTITIADGRGALWQWDTGRRVKVDGGGVEQVHYQNRCFGATIDVDVGTDGTAIIPDELLQDWRPITVYAYTTDDTGGYTEVQQVLPVHKRAKPADYVYTPTEQKTLADMQRQIGDLSGLETEAKDNLVAAINEVAKTGSGGAGSISMRTADGYIQYSTDDGETWENLIAVADLKGEPGKDGENGKPGADGAPGPQGPAGDPGKDGQTPIIGDNGNWYIGGVDTGKPSRGAKGDKGDTGAGMDVTGATVGQIAKITAVDENGKPTAWGAVDMPSGDDEWELIQEIPLQADVLIYALGSLVTYKKIRMVAEQKLFTDNTGNKWLRVVSAATKSDVVTALLSPVDTTYAYVVCDVTIDNIFVAFGKMKSNNLQTFATQETMQKPIVRAANDPIVRLDLSQQAAASLTDGAKITVYGVAR